MPWAVARVAAPEPGVLAAYYAAWVAWFAAPRIAAACPGMRKATGWLRRGAVLVLVACGGWIVLNPPVRFGRTASPGGDVHRRRTGRRPRWSGSRPATPLLIDAGGAGGGRFDIGRRVVEPAVWAAGVHRLTYVVATHGDADHVGGAASMVADFRPREVWEGVPVPPEPLLGQLRGRGGPRGAGWRRVQRGDRVRLGEAEVVAWHPQPPEWERQRVRNDDSVVVEVRFGEVSLLLTGDVEASAEAEVAPLLEPRRGARDARSAPRQRDIEHLEASSRQPPRTWPYQRGARQQVRASACRGPGALPCDRGMQC